MPGERGGTMKENQDSGRKAGRGDHEFEDLLRAGFL